VEGPDLVPELDLGDLDGLQVARLPEPVVLVVVARVHVEGVRLGEHDLLVLGRRLDRELHLEAERLLRLLGDGCARLRARPAVGSLQVDAEAEDTERARERGGLLGRWRRLPGGWLSRWRSRLPAPVAAAGGKERAETKRRRHAHAALHQVATGEASLLQLVFQMTLELISIPLSPVTHPLILLSPRRQPRLPASATRREWHARATREHFVYGFEARPSTVNRIKV
jgi:hypothetical protein